MSTREREVEKYLVDKLKSVGLECLKFIPDQANGMPDRVVLLSEGRVVWVELKTEGGRTSSLQKYRHKQLREAGQLVAVVWNKEQVDELVERLSGGGS